MTVASNSMFRVKKRLSERDAYNLVVGMALYGNHNLDPNGALNSVAGIEEHFSQAGLKFKHVVSRCRDFEVHVPMYENVIGPTWTNIGASVSRQDHLSGEWKVISEADGTYNDADYWAFFNIAVEDFHSALASARYDRLLSAVNAGLASIEAFLNEQYIRRMLVPNTDPSLKSSLEWKIDNWVPELTGIRLDKGGRNWAALKKLAQDRNELFQHNKAMTTGIAFKQLANELNLFKYGISRILLELHVAYQVRCPTAVLRSAYFPEIEYVGTRSQLR